MLSYNQIIKLNKEFADAHKVLQNFGNGERWQIVDHNQDATYKYPLMWMEDNASSVASKEFVYSFRVWFVTRVEAPDDLDNELLYSEYAKAKSDMIQCALDLVSYWVQDTNYPSLDIDKNISVETFIDRTKDKDTGCYFDLKFREAYNYDSCIIPMDGITPPPVEVTTITINDDSFTTATCGSTYNVVVKDVNGLEVGSKVGSEWIVPAGGGSFTYDIILNGVDTTQDVIVDGTDITLNLGDY